MFYDCVTDCDGCLELGNPSNNGLSGIYDEVNALYDREFANSGMSLADFIALQAVVAVRVAADEQSCMQLQLPPGCVKPEPQLFIRYGRIDCATSPNSNSDTGFPDAHGDLEHVMTVFRDGMNMSERQVVALIGAHTLGNGCTRKQWVPRTLVTTNKSTRQCILSSTNGDTYRLEPN